MQTGVGTLCEKVRHSLVLLHPAARVSPRVRRRSTPGKRGQTPFLKYNDRNKK